MSQANPKHPTYEADEALAQYRLVKMDADGKITYATATDYADGSVDQTVLAAGEVVPIRPLYDDGSRKLVASGAISIAAPVYQAADGKIAASGTIPIGKAMEAAAANNDVIEVLLQPLSQWRPTGAQQSLSGAGAVNVTSYMTKITTTGANALTLANGVRAGQLKKILMVVDGGDGTLTPTSLSGATTITFNDAGDFVVLLWNGAAWVVVESGNSSDGITGPTIA